MFSAAFHFKGVLLNSFHCLKNSVPESPIINLLFFHFLVKNTCFQEKRMKKRTVPPCERCRRCGWHSEFHPDTELRCPGHRNPAGLHWMQPGRASMPSAHTHTNTLKQTLDETNRECRSYFGKVIWLGVGACGVLNLVLKIYQFWNTARPRALLQNQYTRELISTQKMSPHHNKNWSRLCQLSPGMRANTRYLNCIRRATRVHPQRTFMSSVFTCMPGELL